MKRSPNFQAFDIVTNKNYEHMQQQQQQQQHPDYSYLIGIRKKTSVSFYFVHFTDGNNNISNKQIMKSVKSMLIFLETYLMFNV